MPDFILGVHPLIQFFLLAIMLSILMAVIAFGCIFGRHDWVRKTYYTWDSELNTIDTESYWKCRYCSKRTEPRSTNAMYKGSPGYDAMLASRDERDGDQERFYRRYDEAPQLYDR